MGYMMRVKYHFLEREIEYLYECTNNNGERQHIAEDRYNIIETERKLGRREKQLN